MNALIFRAWVGLIVLALGAPLADALAVGNPTPATTPTTTPTYDELFPLSIKSCVVSRYKDIYHKGVHDFNLWGHSVLFLKGVCRDMASPLPKLQLCIDSVDLTDPNAGTLISVVRAFENTAWIAIEDGRFAFHGALPPQEQIDQVVLRNVGHTAIDRDIFKNIKLTRIAEKRYRYLNLPREQLLPELTLGTDFALGFDRTSYCHVFPVTQRQIEAAVQYLNELNRPHIVEGIPFEWHLFGNNCVHTVNNTLAAVGITKHFPALKNFSSLGLFKVHPPAEVFLKYSKQIVHSFDDFSVKKAFNDPLIRKSFEIYGRPPIVHGTMTQVIPMHTENNQIFAPAPRLFASMLLPKYNKFKKRLFDPRLRVLETNLKMFKGFYEKLKTDLLPLDMLLEEALLEKNRKLDTPEFRAFYLIYTYWLTEASREVDGLILRL